MTVTVTLRRRVEQLFDAIAAKDVEAALALCADDAVFVDPHYPTPRMIGKAAIAEGLRWACASMKTMSFPITTYCESEDGRHAAVEVATAHVLGTGAPLSFPQTFVIDTRDGLITRVQAYGPYGPGGIGGLFLGLIRLKRRLSRQR